MLSPFYLLLLLCTLATSQSPYFAEQYYRTIIQVSDSIAPANPLLDVLDPGHARMATFYTPAQISALLLEGHQWIDQQFGLNFSGPEVSPHPQIPGALVYPGIATLYPYGTDPTQRETRHYKVASDSLNRKRGKQEHWIIHEYGFLILMTASGVFPAGNQSGTSYALNDVLAYAQYNFLNAAANWSSPTCNATCREVMTIRSTVPTKRPTNSYGIAEEMMSVEVIDKDGRICHAQGAGKVYQQGDGSLWRRNRFLTTCDWLPTDQQNPPAPA